VWPLNFETYLQMVKLVTELRKTIRYTEIENNNNFVLWRHDCDMSLNRARHIAEIDAEHGIRATFFILPHSDYYNIFELKQTKLIRELTGLGHDIGLHLDVAYHSAVSGVFDLERSISKDKYLLEEIAETKIEAFSYHNPTPEILKSDSSEYSGLINCYSKLIRETVDYGSDSNGYWRHQPIPDILLDKNKTRLQILTHPEWWLKEAPSPRDHVLRCAYGRAIKTVSNYDFAMTNHDDRDNVKEVDVASNDYERAIKIL
jgi:peptidoglycan/xylan/chitin deacetylase (PgdA/CDA1 family)